MTRVPFFSPPAILAAVLLPVAAAQAPAEFIFEINDPPGAGFNDTTAVSPVPGNDAATLGEQRLNVLTRAAEIIGEHLESPVPIRVNIGFEDLTCSGTSATLGFAGPTGLRANFTNTPLPGYWFPLALANALAGSDLASGDPSIQARFNAQIDDGDCITGVAGFWYGLDRSVPAPDNRFVLLPVALHELAHGLGFLSVVNLDDGSFPAPEGGQPLPDVWSVDQFDFQIDEFWDDMSDGQRLESATNDPNLVWAGPVTDDQASQFLRPPPVVTVTEPGSLAGDFPAVAALFSERAPLSGLSRPVVLADDGSGNPTLACQALVNAAQVAGNIVLIDRGSCEFREKARHAQQAGAAGILIANNAPGGGPILMSPPDYSLILPAFSISRELGDAMTTALGGGPVAATMGYDTGQPALGSTNTLARLHAPAELAPGSSVSHFSLAADPPLLMLPSISRNLFDGLDLTAALFADIGWEVKLDDLIFADGFESQ